MKKDISEIIEVTPGVSVDLKSDQITMKSNGKEVIKKFLENDRIKISLEGNQIKISSKKATKRELKLVNSLISHIKNILAGLKEEYKYTLEICNVHFPTTVKVDGDKLKIKNFLGEKIDRVAQILPNVKAVVKGTSIEVTSPDVEAAGQTAANFEIATKIRNRDRRVFQDGIFITSKPGRRVD
ncbi:50S ribosomal protein L6 [uncultured archaeon]|nr:50S ribosomal protein L6 [uncultured archaeon]